ncbi:MAG: FAD-dependent oxidoreductase, partial [Calditrichaeota bacterium]|nr:FAD-dependent oxidoreductase [Calditrichota bacterium]
MMMKLVGMAMVLMLIPMFAVAQQNVDVVVVGATPGGIASAITAARFGHSVALVEYQNH